MKALVTGGAGFIGSSLSERLLRQGHEIAIVDDLNSFYSPELKQHNLNCIRTAGPISFYQMDICNVSPVTDLIASLRPDAIIHLAARAGVRPSLENPLLYVQTNVTGTAVLLEAARLAKVPKFVFASSSSVYGATNQVPFREDEGSYLPISPYAATKLAGEKLAYTYSQLYGIDVVCLRFFTVYGPRQRPDLAIRKFIGLLLNGEPIPVFGDGSSGRDYTFIDDITAGIVGALNYDARYEVFNLGNSHPVTLKQMISTIEDVLGIRGQRLQLPEQPGDVPITYADISKARRAFGYQPTTSFADGIRRFIEWTASSSLVGAAEARR